MKIIVKELEIFDLEKAYQPDQLIKHPGEFLHPVYFVEQQERKELICCFQKEMKQWLRKEIEEMRSVKDFLLMKDAEKIPDKKKTRYMSIQKKEFQDRVRENRPLPSIEEVIK